MPRSIPGYDFAVIQGLFARAGTPRAVVDRIASEIAVIVKEPEVIAAFDKIGAEPPAGSSADDFARALKDEARARGQGGGGGRHQAAVMSASEGRPTWY